MRLRPSYHQRSRRAARMLYLPEKLESRKLMVGDWSPVQALAPDNGAQTMMLLTDGSVMVQTGQTASKTWSKLTPNSLGDYRQGTFSPLASSGVERLYYPSTVLPSGKVFLVGGEYSGPGVQQNYLNTAEIYDPANNTWTAAATFPEPSFGDTPTSLLRSGKILAGSPFSANTYLYDPQTDTWTFAATKLRNDISVEESWIALPNGDVLSYDIWGSGDTAQYYDAATNQWKDTGPVPVVLVNQFELGAGLQLPDGRVFLIGATNKTALYDPLNNTWVAGPELPIDMGSDDAPAVALPNGHILFVADHPLFRGPSRIFDYDPYLNTLIDVTPPIDEGPNLSFAPAFITRLLVLPNGHALMSTSNSQIWDYAPDGLPAEHLRPTITNVKRISTSSYELIGTRLNGYSEGAAYGDDAQMSSNYPIVQLTNKAGQVFYARTSSWTPGLTTNNQLASTRFELPPSLPAGNYQLRVIANGIASAPANFSTQRGLSVLLTSPAQDSTISSRPITFKVSFNMGVNQATLQASDLKVNGKSAQRVTWDTSQNSATFTFSQSPVSKQGKQLLQIAAGAVKGIDGSKLAAFSSQFNYDAAPLLATSISPVEGSFLTIPPSNVDLVFNLSEAIDPRSVDIDDLYVSRGTVTKAVAIAGHRAVRYTVSGLDSEGALSVILNDGSLRDSFGNAYMRGRAATFTLDFGKHASMAQWSNGAIGGADEHIGANHGSIQKPNDVDGYDVNLDAGQIVSVHVDSDYATGLQLGARLIGPDGTILRSVAAEFSGDEVFLPGYKAAKAGTYRIEVIGLNATQGTYRLRANINADLESEFYFQGRPNQTPTNAQSLEPAFQAVGSSRTGGMKASVLGENFNSLELPVATYTFESADEGIVADGLWHISQRRGDEEGHFEPGSAYYGIEATGTYDTGAANAGTLTTGLIPLDPHGQLTLSFDYVLQTEEIEGVDIASVEISTDNGATYSTILTNAVTGQLPESIAWRPMSVDISEFAGEIIRLRFSFDTVDDIANEFEGWYIDDVVITHSGQWNDYFAFTAEAGQTIDAVVTSTSGDSVRLDLEDIHGQLIAAGSSGTNFESGVQRFIAPTAGTYYVRVYGQLASTYELLVTRGALLETAPNGQAATATVLPAGVTALGHVASSVRQELTFASGADGVVIDNTLGGTGSSAGLWHLSTRRGNEPGHSGPNSFYYGSESTGTYNTGAANAGSFTTPEFAVPSVNPQLSFNYILRTLGFATEDFAIVYVSADNFVSFEALLFGAFSMPLANQWTPISVDLSAYANKTVRFQFVFNTFTALNNDFEGWYVDDIAVSNGQRPDWYAVTLGPNDTAISLWGRTFGSSTSQVSSSLDLKLELYDATGTVLIASGIHQRDGWTEKLVLGGLTPGATYKIRLSAEGDTEGEYSLTFKSSKAENIWED